MSHVSSTANRQFRNRPFNRGNTSKPRPTHFISLPIGHHASLRKSVSSFTTGLLETRPILPGLDRTIVIPPRRLHLTLGVMSLEDSEASNNALDGRARKTISEALSLLSSLKPRISELLCGTRLCVPLQTMSIMPPEGGDPDKAHVLWIGPSRMKTHDGYSKLAVKGMVNKTFMDAGFITDRRDLKLHCTILNTVYRRPGVKGLRQPFSYRSLLRSSATHAVATEQGTDLDWREPVKVDLGTWDVDEIQICKMGSWGPEGEYESCGGLLLGGPQP